MAEPKPRHRQFFLIMFAALPNREMRLRSLIVASFISFKAVSSLRNLNE